jgi:hypothetical protein
MRGTNLDCRVMGEQFPFVMCCSVPINKRGKQQEQISNIPESTSSSGPHDAPLQAVLQFL